MKKIILLLLTMIAIQEAGYSQMQQQAVGGGGEGPNPGEEVCEIRYEYDAAGQRIKRYVHCYIYGDIEPPLYDINWQVFPNPTDGDVKIYSDFEEWLDLIQVSVVSMGGVQIYQESCTECVQMEFDISGAIPGNYIVHIFWQKNGVEGEESITLTKLE